MANPQEMRPANASVREDGRSVITVADVRAMLRAGLAEQAGQSETFAPDVLSPSWAGAAPAKSAAPDAAMSSPAEAELPVVPSASGKPVTKRVPGRRKKGSAS